MLNNNKTFMVSKVGMPRSIDDFLTEMLNDFYFPATIPQISKAFENYPVSRVSVHKENGTHKYEIAVTGFEEKDIALECEDGVLKITAKHQEQTEEEKNENEKWHFIHRELSTKKFTRTVPLPKGADVDSIKANVKNGILAIEVPIKKDVRRIRITQ